MYLKLAFRNAKRSMLDYLLYILSMVVLTAVICVSNCLANLGEMGAGFQTISLPLLIVILMAVLADCINTFIIRQRAKEFATYMLFGMEKVNLSLLFLWELAIVGMVCFFLGAALGTGIYFAYSHIFPLAPGSGSASGIIAKSWLWTFVYFWLVEALSMALIKRKIYRLQIVRLMQEKRRSRPVKAKGKVLWGCLSAAGFLAFLLLLSCIAFMSEGMMQMALSVVVIPMLLCIFSFYKWVYAFLASMRLSKADVLYRGNRLYRMAEITTGSRIGAGLNAVFSVCLIFSAASFVFGVLLAGWDIPVYSRAERQWMGFLQIGICIIFMAVYFFILSFLQIVDLKREAGNIRLLFYMGKSWPELKALLCAQIRIKLFFPTAMSFAMLWAAVPFANRKVNAILPMARHNLLLYCACGFMLCFAVLYCCYFYVVYTISMKYMKANLEILK